VNHLVFDGTVVRIPEAMGTPRADQMQGTELERLAELCGRVCYDSLGKGRSSVEFHKHILDVGHLSVHEHGQFTLALPLPLPEGARLRDWLGRPGVTAWRDTDTLRVTLNTRVLLDWQRFGNHTPLPAEISVDSPYRTGPVTDDERWVSIYMVGSRGFSHEQCRHGDFTAISQRSTRYCDESESPWCWHPLLKEFLAAFRDSTVGSPDSQIRMELNDICDYGEKVAKETYDHVVKILQPWLISKELDKLTARKQARGAARGFLGNALQTEMIFSASITQWNWMIQQRMSPAADAEIRMIYKDQVLPALKASQYAERTKAI
jgi:thymidylate synthase ThyX